MKKLLVIAVVAALATVSFAQGGGMRMMMRGGGNLLQLARREDVAKELNLTSDQKTKLDDLQQSMREEMRAQFQSSGGNAGGGQPDQAAMQKVFQDMQEKQKTAMAGILSVDQMTRLKELSIQRQGNNAIMDPDIQTALGLSADQKSKIKDLQDKQMEAMQAVMEKVRNQEIDPSEARTTFQKNNDVMKTELGKLLTADQAKKLADMGGKPFTFDASLDNQRGPGGK